MTTTISSKGQIVIPLDIRKQIGIKPGDDFIVLRSSKDDILLRPIQKQKSTGLLASLRKLKGLKLNREDETVRDIAL